MILSICCGQTPLSAGSDWKIAECSLSIGNSLAPPCVTASTNTSPPSTKASLLASKRRFPARAAPIQGANPAAPTMAAITASTFSCEATMVSASAPHNTRVLRPRSRHRCCSRSPWSALAMIPNSGLNLTHCATIRSTWVAAVKAKTSKRCGCRPITSSVLVPTDPVDPRIATRSLGAFIGCCAASWPWEGSATGHQPGPTHHHDRATGRCCL